MEPIVATTEGRSSRIFPGYSYLHEDGTPIDPALKRGQYVVRQTTEVDTVYQLWLRSVRLYGDRPCLGTRSFNTDGTRGEYQWISYRETWDRALKLGAGLIGLGVQPGDRIGIYSLNRAEVLIAEAACAAYSLISVPLYDTLGPDAVKYITQHSEMTTIIFTPAKLESVQAFVRECPTVRHLVQMETLPAALAAAGVLPSEDPSRAPLTLHDWDRIIAMGTKNPVEPIPPRTEDLASIIFTSGTTGVPKGVMVSHDNVIAVIVGPMHAGYGINCEDIHLSYLPLAHCAERGVVFLLLLQGGAIGFYQGQIPKLSEDIAALRPTLFIGPPRVFIRLRDAIESVVAKSFFVKRWMFQIGYSQKLKQILRGYDSPFWNRLIFNKISEKLGGRVRFILSLGAPLSPDLQRFMQVCFGCVVTQGYGLTETMAGIACQPCRQAAQIGVGNVGRPIVGVELKLLSIPEMEYDVSDLPNPRGEILVRGPHTFSGYWRDPERTAEVLDSEGWLHTGDVGEIRADGCLCVVDRVKNIFKLSQGEYVVPEYLEGIFERSPLISQCYVYGDPYRSVLVGVVVPNDKEALAYARTHNLPQTPAELAQSAPFIEKLLEDVGKYGRRGHLKGFQLLRALAVDFEPWTVENHCLTPTLKLRRANLKRKYQTTLDQLYDKCR